MNTEEFLVLFYIIYFVYVYVVCVCRCVYLYEYLWRRQVVLSITLGFSLWDEVSNWNWASNKICIKIWKFMFCDLHITFLSLSPRRLGTGTHNHMFVTWVLWFQLRFSCLHSKHSYPVNHISGPIIVLVVVTVNEFHNICWDVLFCHRTSRNPGWFQTCYIGYYRCRSKSGSSQWDFQERNILEQKVSLRTHG